MEKYIFGDQIKIYFQDGSTVTAQVISEDDNNLECSALSKNEVYKEGDSIFVDKKNSKIEKLNGRKSYILVQFRQIPINSKFDSDETQYTKVDEDGAVDVMEKYRIFAPLDNVEVQKSWFKNIKKSRPSFAIKKTSRTFNWEFDIHKSQWKINKESMEIERDDDAVTKIAKLRNKLNITDNLLGGLIQFLINAKEIGFKTNYLSKYIEDGVRAYKDNTVLIAKLINNELVISVVTGGDSDVDTEPIKFVNDLDGAFNYVRNVHSTLKKTSAITVDNVVEFLDTHSTNSNIEQVLRDYGIDSGNYSEDLYRFDNDDVSLHNIYRDLKEAYTNDTGKEIENDLDWRNDPYYDLENVDKDW